MITFFVAVVALILGYVVYGKISERIFKIDPDRATPAVLKADGVDYMQLPVWKILLIQFLNIAGLGPIFGALAGALWGPVAFLWIVLGSIFAGGVHDYFSGMLSLKHDGKSVSEISAVYLGGWIKQFMRVFTVILMVIVGAVFILGPARILSEITGEFGSVLLWTLVILAYYLLSTVLPINKVIGKIYPLFGMALIFMALGLIIAVFVQGVKIPELTVASFSNFHYESSDFPVFPLMFITIACGAISGFHATQSPLMARCLPNERKGRTVFYGAMIIEGVVALIWAAVGMSFYGGIDGLNAFMVANDDNAALAVNEISNSLLGPVGGFLALMGVVAAPITSGDTSFRSARLIVSDSFNFDQAPIRNRLLVSIPLFVLGYALTFMNFGVIWRYFAWTNQTLATIVLWTITYYLISNRKFYWISLIPALFMTVVVISYILIAPEGFSFPYQPSVIAAILISLSLAAVALTKVYRLGDKLVSTS